jgi:hypothetical protein
MKRIFLAAAMICGVVVAGVAADQRGRAGRVAPGATQGPRQGDLKPGDLAPDFTLEPRGGGAAVVLSAFRGRQPVALVFGSYT